MVYILGLNLSHNATACLLKDGEVIGCISEERFVRIKNYSGFPKKAVKCLLDKAGIMPSQIDFVTVGGETLTHEWNPQRDFKHPVKRFLFLVYYLMSLSPLVDKIFRQLHYFLTKLPSKSEIYDLIEDNLHVPREKILLASHHLCHAYAAYFGFVPERARSGQFLILTHDAEGDMLCGLIAKAQGNTIKVLERLPAGNSLAAIYGDVTDLLGMKINEHEYKVMGLAPYANSEEVQTTYPIFDALVKVSGTRIQSTFGMRATYMYLLRKLAGQRFDGVAGSTQKLIETKTVEWIRNVIGKYRDGNLVLGGGLFMNVKLNKLIGEIKEVKKLYVCPSSGDESNAIGAVYFGYRYFCKEENLPFLAKPIANLYLGPAYSQSEIEKAIRAKRLKFKKIKNPERTIARLLAKGQVVARFAGAMEWGARALGARSILADPRDTSVIRIINEQIKNRDFWMPFAPTILQERARNYIKNSKKIASKFMTLTFDATIEAKKEIPACLHPYDFTCRPQILDKKDNPDYYQIIKEFEKITGVGAVLNTSFNLHGEPIVCSPEDAIDTFLRSGLNCLSIGDYILIKK